MPQHHVEQEQRAKIEELEPVLDRFTPLGRTTTSIVNATPVPRRPLPVTETELGLVADDLG